MTRSALHTTPRRGYLIAFGELFLKSEGVRSMMVRTLLKHLAYQFQGKNIAHTPIPLRSRIFIATESLKAKRVIKNTFGIEWTASALWCEQWSLDQVASFIQEHCHEWIGEKESFALVLHRDPHSSLSREKIIDTIASHIKRKVNLSHPDKTIYVESRKEGWFIYWKKEQGQGGLPVASQGKVCMMMSGGIDSPVASLLLSRRGADLIWVHFHSFPLVSRASMEKVQDLAKTYATYHPRITVWQVPFSEIQVQIKLHAQEKYRVLLYKRYMMLLARAIAKKEQCHALGTGDSLGQVSSQTLQNMGIVQKGIALPVLRPLIGMDKNEIIRFSKKKGFFDISIRPQEDCCTLFVSGRQTAEGKEHMMRTFEKDLRLGPLMRKAIRQATVLKPKS